MLAIIIIGVIAGIWTFIFILMELDDVIESKGLKNTFINTMHLITDIVLTLSFTTIFSFGAGMMGIILGLIASGFVSTYLWHKKRQRKLLKLNPERGVTHGTQNYYQQD